MRSRDRKGPHSGSRHNAFNARDQLQNPSRYLDATPTAAQARHAYSRRSIPRFPPVFRRLEKGFDSTKSYAAGRAVPARELGRLRLTFIPAEGTKPAQKAFEGQANRPPGET